MISQEREYMYMCVCTSRPTMVDGIFCGTTGGGGEGAGAGGDLGRGANKLYSGTSYSIHG